jgi:hypothetical protein
MNALPFLNQQRGWAFSPVTKVFSFPKSTTGPTSEDVIGRERIIKTALHYANELEAIV